MPLYITIADDTGADVNIVPFTRTFDAVMSSFNTVSAATIALTEMPGRFAAEFDDLYTRIGFTKGKHVRAWQTETIGGVETIVWRWFGGLLVDAHEDTNTDENPLGREYALVAQGYDAAALDSVAKPFTVITVPAGTLASQITYVLGQYNSGASLVIDLSGVVNITGGHSFGSFKIMGLTLRQVLRAIASRVRAYDQSIIPYFTVDVSHLTTGPDFLGPTLYFYDVAAPGSPEVQFIDVPTTGWSTTIGKVSVGHIGRPPFATRAIGRNIGGKTVTATATSASTYHNPFHPSGYWDVVVDNMANADSEMAGEVARLAARNSVPLEEPAWSSYGRARPGQWVTLQNSRQHGYTSGKTILVTGASVSWTNKTYDTTIDGQTVGNPVIISYDGSNHIPLLLEDGDNGADMQQVLALTPSNSSRNAIQASVADDYSLNVKSDDGQYYISWYRHGHHHPIGRALNFTAIGQIRSFKAEDDYEQIAIDDPTDSTVGWIVRQNGISQTMPFDGLKDDIITIELQTAPTPPTATTPLGATIKERARLVPP